MLDDDDRALMRYKEMYLPDGDLYSEGNGRVRRFHWKEMGKDFQILSNRIDELHFMCILGYWFQYLTLNI